MLVNKAIYPYNPGRIFFDESFEFNVQTMIMMISNMNRKYSYIYTQFILFYKSKYVCPATYYYVACIHNIFNPIYQNTLVRK